MCEVRYRFGVKLKEELSILDENNIISEEMEDWIVKYMDEHSDMFIPIDELGLSEEDINNPEYMTILKGEDIDDDIKTELQEELAAEKVIKLYRYVAAPGTYGASNVGPNTRPFCRELVRRSSLAMLPKQSITNLNSSNPGFGKGGSDTYSIFNWRGGVNCKHVWVRYLFQPSTNSLVKDTKQPTQTGAGSVPRYNK